MCCTQGRALDAEGKEMQRAGAGKQSPTGFRVPLLQAPSGRAYGWVPGLHPASKLLSTLWAAPGRQG